jgi:hypothetical protein
MGKNELSGRDIWQDYSGEHASHAEKKFYRAFMNYFQGTDFRIREKPNELKNIYVDYPLPPDVESSIYHPDEPITHHGISPDYAIENLRTHKILYVEVKRQDGWVEGKPRSAGRGNAHERACKLFTPGLINIYRYYGNIRPPALPFWIVFQGDITRDPCRVREIYAWFCGPSPHFFLWNDKMSDKNIREHFDNYLRPLLL